MQGLSADHLSELTQAGLRGAGDARDNMPAADTALPSHTELDVLAKAREIHAELRQDATARLNALSAEILKAREDFVEDRYVARVRATQSTMRAVLTKSESELGARVHEALKARREYAFFSYKHRREADPKVEKWQFLLCFLVVPLVLESLLNGNFFAEASDFGLIGGAATAVIISALNITLGFLLGLWPARYCQHVKRSHLLWALPACVAMVGLIVMFNLAVGHYRELLIATPDARSLQVMPRMLANPLGLGELKSIALVIIGCVVALFAAAKGYSAFGTYPGHGAAYQRLVQRQRAVEDERKRVDVDLVAELEETRGQVELFRQDCKAQIDDLQRAKARNEQIRETYAMQVARLRNAKDASLAAYREANLKVRTDLPPAHFSQGLTIPEIDRPDILPEHERISLLIADFERQLSNLPSLVEMKLKDQLDLVAGFDIAGEIERLKLRAAQIGQDSFAQEEAARKTMRAEFAATSP